MALAVDTPFDVVGAFFVEFRLTIDQDVVWPNSAIAGAHDRTESSRLRCIAAHLHVLREIDAPCKGLIGPHQSRSRPSWKRLCSNRNSVKFFRSGSSGGGNGAPGEDACKWSVALDAGLGSHFGRES